MKIGQQMSTFLAALSILPTLAYAIEPDQSQVAKTPDQTQEETYRGWKKPDFAAFFEGHSFSEGKNEENLVRLDLDASTRYTLADWSYFQFSPRLVLSNGRVQQRFDVEASQSARFSLRDTYVSLHTSAGEWLENVELRLGAHWQRFLRSSMLVSGRRSFIGAQERAALKFDPEWKLKFVSQQVIPDSSSDDGFRDDREKTPLFTTETLALEWKRKDVAEVTPFITHYRYSNLPAVVAADSATIGNTVDGQVGPDSRFRYAFNGWMAGVDTTYHLTSSLGIELYVYNIQNDKAPAGARRAQWVQFGTPIDISDTMSLKPSYAQYFIEADVVPAIYNSGTLGHNNRTGQRIGLDIDFKKLGFAIETRYIQANTITETPEQNKLYSFYIGLAIGTQYDVL